MDVWAFGCALYECLTAKRAFDGETMTDDFAAVIEREPDWSTLPAATPARVLPAGRWCVTGRYAGPKSLLAGVEVRPVSEVVR